MKAKFNKTWNSSKQPRKQRKFRANAPLHIKRKFLGAMIEKELAKKEGIKTTTLRKGDEVKVMRGKFAKKQGKIGKIDVKNTRIQIEGIQRTKKGGEKLETWFHPSKVKIISLNKDDAKRFKNTKKETKKEEKEEKKITKKETKEKK